MVFARGAIHKAVGVPEYNELCCNHADSVREVAVQRLRGPLHSTASCQFIHCVMPKLLAQMQHKTSVPPTLTNAKGY